MNPEIKNLASISENRAYAIDCWRKYYSLLPAVKNKTVVDLCCGNGFGAALLASSATNVIAIDASEANITYASRKFNKAFPNLNFFKNTLNELPVATLSVDICICASAEPTYIEIDEKTLTHIKRFLKEDGILVIAPNAASERDISEISKFMSSHFQNVAYTFKQAADLTHSQPPNNTEAGNTRTGSAQQHTNTCIAFASDDLLLNERISVLGYEIVKSDNNSNEKILRLDQEVKSLKDALKIISDENENITRKLELYQNTVVAAEQNNHTLINDLESTKHDYEVKLEQLKTHHELELQRLQGVIKEQAEEKERLETGNKSLLAKTGFLAQSLEEKERLLQDTQYNFALTRQQLNDVNNRLVTIYDSDGWKWLERYYNVKGKYLNESSAHYKALKKTVNFIRNKKGDIITAPPPPIAKDKPSGNTIEQEARREIVIRSLPFFEKPTVSIIIPVYNAWEMNEKCVVSILQNTTDVAYEVIIADDGSTDETKNITTYFKNIVHIRNEKNLGFLHNCNNAARHVRSRYIHFLNNDTEVRAGWLSSLVRIMETDDKAGMTGSKLIYPEGRLQEAGGIIWNDASGWNYGQGQNPEMPEFNYLKETDYISGASLMIRTSLWNDIGGFDTRFAPAYCEDSDLAFMVREKGFKVIYQPLSEVVHYEGYSHGNDREQSAISTIKEYQTINNKKFFDKWKTVLQRDHFPNAENVFWAKDRSRHKKTLLMVDHYVPQFDKDAGSRTTFQYLQLFLKLGFNIKFLGENFYKHEPYTTVLQQMGIEVLYGPWYRDNWQQWFKENSEKFDYIYLNRPHISINFIDFFKQMGKAKILYYGHDLHFLRERKRYEVEKNAAILEQAAKWEKIESYLFNKSDVILTPSIDEQQVIRALDHRYNVQLMRPYIYQTVGDAITSFQQRNDLLFVGGFGHLPNVDSVLWFVKEVWPFVKVDLKNIRFIIAGSNPPEEIRQLASNDVIVKGYVSDDELGNLYNTCKIAVIPLRYGAGVKGKTVEAMRYGIPIVTTAFGVEGLPDDYSFLPVFDTSQGFAEALVSLYNNEDTLRELSRKSVEYIESNFTEAIATHIIQKALATIE